MFVENHPEFRAEFVVLHWVFFFHDPSYEVLKSCVGHAARPLNELTGFSPDYELKAVTAITKHCDPALYANVPTFLLQAATLLSYG